MTQIEELLKNAHTGDLFRTRCGKVVEIIGEQMAHKSGELLLDGFVGELDNLRKLYIFSYDYGNGKKHIFDTDQFGISSHGDRGYDIIGKWHESATSNQKSANSEQYGQMKELYETLLETWRRKNSDYGNSFDKGIEKRGYISALTRMDDKFNRIDELLSNPGECLVKDEAVDDTLLDLANYCVMLVRYRREKKKKHENT